MGGKSSGSNEAAQARKDEANRQATIRNGTANINSIFDGGVVRPQIASTGGAFDFGSGQYFNADGTPRTDKVNSFDNEQVFGPSTTNTGQFNDAFFNQQKQNYLDYATPQLDKQNTAAQKDLTFSLDRSGLLNSSVRSQKTSDLASLYDTNKQKVESDALGYENTAKTNVEDARANLISELNTTGDAAGTTNAAIARAGALAQPSSYSALGNLFTDFTNTLNTQAAQEKAAAASNGSYTIPYNTGLFGSTGKVSVRS